MIPSLNLTGFTSIANSATSNTCHSAKTEASYSLQQPLAADVFFCGGAKKSKEKTRQLFQAVTDPSHELNAEALHARVIELLSQGADPHQTDKNGKTAADHLRKLKLYSKDQVQDAYRYYNELMACNYTFGFNIREHASEPEEKPLPKTIEILRDWAVNEGGSLRDDAASTFSEATPLLRTRGKHHRTFHG